MSENEIKLNDFTSCNTITIKEKQYKLDEFSLASELWAEETYGSVENFYKKLLGGFHPENDNLTPASVRVICELMFHLMDNRYPEFPTMISLAKSITGEEAINAGDTVIKIVHQAIMPLKKRLTEAAKAKATQQRK